MKRLLCFFLGHDWGRPVEFVFPHNDWWGHYCKRCGIDESLPIDMWDELWKQQAINKVLEEQRWQDHIRNAD